MSSIETGTLIQRTRGANVADILDFDRFRKNCDEFFEAEQAKQKHMQDGLTYTQIYSNMVCVLVQEYENKGWGALDEKAMEGIIQKAKAVAKLHHKVANAAF